MELVLEWINKYLVYSLTLEPVDRFNKTPIYNNDCLWDGLVLIADVM